MLLRLLVVCCMQGNHGLVRRIVSVVLPSHPCAPICLRKVFEKSVKALTLFHANRKPWTSSSSRKQFCITRLELCTSSGVRLASHAQIN